MEERYLVFRGKSMCYDGRNYLLKHEYMTKKTNPFNPESEQGKMWEFKRTGGLTQSEAAKRAKANTKATVPKKSTTRRKK